MKNNPYLVLMLTDLATEQEIEEAYTRLKKQYANDRFLEGEQGNIAAKKLEELEVAHNDILEDLKTKKAVNDFGSIYGEIESYIKQGKLDESQNKLDNIHERNGEWHYLQSILFYRKNWHSESKKQLEIAVALEPENAKYKDALTKLENVINSPKGAVPPPNSYGENSANQQSEQKYQQDSSMGGQPQMAGTGSCCLQLLCADTCCECMGGDLISCC